jgi:hypothetical protein
VQGSQLWSRRGGTFAFCSGVMDRGHGVALIRAMPQSITSMAGIEGGRDPRYRPITSASALARRLTFASMRRSLEARVDRVAVSDRGTKVARRTKSARGSRAPSWFCSCVWKRSVCLRAREPRPTSASVKATSSRLRNWCPVAAPAVAADEGATVAGGCACAI